jgi:hypothetical protein
MPRPRKAQCAREKPHRRGMPDGGWRGVPPGQGPYRQHRRASERRPGRADPAADVAAYPATTTSAKTCTAGRHPVGQHPGAQRRGQRRRTGGTPGTRPRSPRPTAAPPHQSRETAEWQATGGEREQVRQVGDRQQPRRIRQVRARILMRPGRARSRAAVANTTGVSSTVASRLSSAVVTANARASSRLGRPPESRAIHARTT